MDSVSSYKEKLNSFNIKDLKDILTRLGISKQGRKKDLVDRITYLLSAEASDLHNLAEGQVAGTIDEVFRKSQGTDVRVGLRELQGTDATSSSMNEERLSEIDDLKPKVVEKMIRCPCGSSLPIEPMIQCVDPSCGVLQHMSCVIIPEESLDESKLWRHYCEICRLNRADPFRSTVKHLLSPVKLTTLSIPHDGSNPVQNVESTFQLSKADKSFLRHNDYNVQVWCILLNDKVPFRMQWPLYADLKVNGVPVRTVTRPGSQLLGANGRDDGPMIAFYMVDGFNRISLSGWDARSFCTGVRIVKENTVQQVLDLILAKQNNETFEKALARVQRCIGGGMAMTAEDSDSDLEVVSDFVTVNLRCPMGGYRIKTAGRFRPCAHMGCFDLETFVQLNQRSRKWQCPICLKNYSLEDIMVDPYFNRITKMMAELDEDVTEVEVNVDGSWRVKKGGGIENLDQWHLEHIEDGKPSKLGETQTMKLQQGEHLGNYSEGVSAMSSSSFENNDVDVIVLSDSDEETPSSMCPEPVSIPKAFDDVGNVDSALGIPNSLAESRPCDVGISSSLHSFSSKDDKLFTTPEGLDASIDSSVCHPDHLDSPLSCDLNPPPNSSQKSNCTTSGGQDLPKQYESSDDVKHPNGPFSFPRRARSARQRMSLDKLKMLPRSGVTPSSSNAKY